MYYYPRDQNAVPIVREQGFVQSGWKSLPFLSSSANTCDVQTVIVCFYHSDSFWYHFVRADSWSSHEVHESWPNSDYLKFVCEKVISVTQKTFEHCILLKRKELIPFCGGSKGYYTLQCIVQLCIWSSSKKVCFIFLMMKLAYFWLLAICNSILTCLSTFDFCLSQNICVLSIHEWTESYKIPFCPLLLGLK